MKPRHRFKLQLDWNTINNMHNLDSCYDHILVHTPEITHIFQHYKNKEYDQNIFQSKEKLSSIIELLQDVFTALYANKIEYEDVKVCSLSANIYHEPVIKCLLENDIFVLLNEITTNNPVPAFEGTVAFVQHLLDNWDAIRNVIADDPKLIDKLSELESQLPYLLTDLEIADTEEEKTNIAYEILFINRQIEVIQRKIKVHIHTHKDILAAIVTDCLNSAYEAAKSALCILNSWGNGKGVAAICTSDMDILNKVKSSKNLMDISMHLGRLIELCNAKKKNSFAYGRGEKYSITQGNNIEQALSSEISLLSLDKLKPFFIQKYQEGKIKQYAKRDKIEKGRGDIVFCLDESESMTEDIAWGKALASVLLNIARQNNRQFALVRFADSNNYENVFFRPGEYTSDDVMQAMEGFLNGGTDYMTPLKEAIRIIREENSSNADIVFVTDGYCSIDKGFATMLAEEKQSLNFRITGILIDESSPGFPFSLKPFCDDIYRTSELAKNDLAELMLDDFI